MKVLSSPSILAYILDTCTIKREHQEKKKIRNLNKQLKYYFKTHRNTTQDKTARQAQHSTDKIHHIHKSWAGQHRCKNIIPYKTWVRPSEMKWDKHNSERNWKKNNNQSKKYTKIIFRMLPEKKQYFSLQFEMGILKHHHRSKRFPKMTHTHTHIFTQMYARF